MTHLLMAAALVLAAQPPKDDPPKKDAPPARVAPAVRAALDEVEVLEAKLATRRAHVKAAELAADGAKEKYNLVARAAGTTTRAETLAAKLDADAAAALVDIRKAEANEVAVELRHAKRRAEEAAKVAVADGPEARRAVAAAAKAEADVAAVREQLLVRRRGYERSRERYADPNAPDIVKARRAVEAAEAQVEAAEARQAATAAEVERLKAGAGDGSPK